MIDLNDPIQATRFILNLERDIDKFCIEHFSEEPRKHLGASIIGHPCQAYSWGVFRWLKQEAFSGQMYRLFNRGHTEEYRITSWLRGCGFTVSDLDDNGQQFRIRGHKGHFGGSLDAKIWRLDIGSLLGEFKTHNQRSFDDLKKKGVIKSKPKHYKQMCVYGKNYNYEFGVYIAVNKNTDEIHFEIVKLDCKEADDLNRKAAAIIDSQTQPPKIAQVETYEECKYCAFKGICFKGEAPEVNCRSCRNAFPVDNGEWWCSVHQANIPEEIIPQACPAYSRII